MSKPLVIIKGIKDGLVFLLDAHAPFPTVISELNHKLTHSHGPFLDGPLTHVHVRTGTRIVTDELRQVIRESFGTHGNLLVRSISGEDELTHMPVVDEKLQEHVHAAPLPDIAIDAPTVHLVPRMVRSGDVIEHKNDVLVVGDVNPGAIILAGGNIFVMGWLRGIAHAGYDAEGRSERTDKVIVATGMAPTQLRIGSIVTRAPEDRHVKQALMEVAYAQDGAIHVTSAQHLGKLHVLRGG